MQSTPTSYLASPTRRLAASTGVNPSGVTHIRADVSPDPGRPPVNDNGRQSCRQHGLRPPRHQPHRVDVGRRGADRDGAVDVALGAAQAPVRVDGGAVGTVDLDVGVRDGPLRVPAVAHPPDQLTGGDRDTGSDPRGDAPRAVVGAVVGPRRVVVDVVQVVLPPLRVADDDAATCRRVVEQAVDDTGLHRQERLQPVADEVVALVRPVAPVAAGTPVVDVGDRPGDRERDRPQLAGVDGSGWEHDPARLRFGGWRDRFGLDVLWRRLAVARWWWSSSCRPSRPVPARCVVVVVSVGAATVVVGAGSVGTVVVGAVVVGARRRRRRRGRRGRRGLRGRRRRRASVVVVVVESTVDVRWRRRLGSSRRRIWRRRGDRGRRLPRHERRDQPDGGDDHHPLHGATVPAAV